MRLRHVDSIRKLIVPTGNRRLQIGDGDTQLYLPFETGKHWFDERLFVYTEEGFYVCFNDSRQDAWYYGLAAEWKWTKKLTTLGEIGGFVFPNGGMRPDDPLLQSRFHVSFATTTDGMAMSSAGLLAGLARDTGPPRIHGFLGFQGHHQAPRRRMKIKRREDKDAEKGAEGTEKIALLRGAGSCPAAVCGA